MVRSFRKLCPCARWFVFAFGVVFAFVVFVVTPTTTLAVLIAEERFLTSAAPTGPE